RHGNRVYSPADRPQSLRHPGHRAGRESRAHLQRCPAVPGIGSFPPRTADPVSGTGAVAAGGVTVMSEPRLDINAVLPEPLALARRADRAIGYVGLDIPEDMLAAPAHVAAHLPWDRMSSTPWADQWLEDSFPGWARCILESWSAGMFDHLAAVVFSRGDD